MDLSDIPSTFPSPTPGIHLLRRADLLGAGYDVDDIRQGLRSGSLRRVAPGRYRGENGRVLSAPDAHRLLILSVGDRNRASVVSHRSAAVLHGIPLLTVAEPVVHLTRGSSTGARSNNWVTVHSARLDACDVMAKDGLQVTTVSRTLLDLARTSGFEEATVALDFALHRRLVTPSEIVAAVHRMAHARGMGRARRSILFADGRSESVGESRCRVALHRARVPAPELQVEIRSVDGKFLGRSDFGWIERRSLMEFDGLVKYVPADDSGRTGAEILVAEKRREDAIRAAGCAMCRAIWGDLTALAHLQDLVRSTMRAGERFLGADGLGLLLPAPPVRVRL